MESPEPYRTTLTLLRTRTYESTLLEEIPSDISRYLIELHLIHDGFEGRFFFLRQVLDLFWGSWFYAFLLLCFSPSLLFLFSAFLLLCFSASLLFCFPCLFAFPAYLLFYFSAFPASLLLCLSTSTILLFLLSVCVFATLLPAPLLLCLLSVLSLCFSFSFALFSPVCILNEPLERP